MRGSLVLYALFWLVRLNGCLRRGRQPLLRGREWFFDVHVPPDFYEGEGQNLLRWYWMRMMIPFAIDIPIATWIILSGRFVWLNGLVVVLGVLIHANHLVSVDLAERQARRFAVDEPVAAVMLSLTPRRLREHVNWKLELALIVTTISACIWDHEHWKALVILLYLHVGLVYVKHLIVAWRRPVPREQAEEHIAVQEAKRKYYLGTIDCWRGALTMQVLVWRAPVVVWFVIAIVATIVVEIKRKQLARFALRARPVIMPDLLGQAEIARWPFCYAPSAPLLMLKGARGYSINLANACAVIGLAYIAGFMVLGHAL